MKLVIKLAQRDPPSGTIHLNEGREETVDVDFAGWLGLVGRLYEVLLSRPGEASNEVD